MDVTPQSIAGATFRVVKKGFDPDEVREYLGRVAQQLADSRDQAALMEQRARQAVGRLQELQTRQADEMPPVPPVAPAPAAPVRADRIDDTETISRTLLLAQRTADAAVAEAHAEADQIRSGARREADTLLTNAQADADQIVESARDEGRRAADAERLIAERELQQLIARLEFLRSDVSQLESHTAAHRDRLRLAVTDLQALIDGELHLPPAPALSAAGDSGLPSRSLPMSDPTPAPSFSLFGTDTADEVQVDQEPTADVDGYDYADEHDVADDAVDPGLGLGDPAFAVPDDEGLFHADDDVTAEVPVVDPRLSGPTMRIFGDDL